MTTNLEHTLHGAVDAFADAAHALTGPRVTAGGVRAPRLTELRDALAGEKATTLGGVPRSMPPLWVDGADLLREVDDTVTTWHRAAQLDPPADADTLGYPTRLDYNPAPPRATTTVERLRALADAGVRVWRPQDVPDLQACTNLLQQWATRADRLLDGEDERTLELVAPCPQCDQRTVYRRDSGGEYVRSAALQVTASVGCRCQACGTVWGPQYLPLLADVLLTGPPRERLRSGQQGGTDQAAS